MQPPPEICSRCIPAQKPNEGSLSIHSCVYFESFVIYFLTILFAIVLSLKGW